ncbi:23S rRNA (adenine(2503)-C(2))-methyltransferase RlmN [Natranaerobius thermophilus]|uniref:Probable dual-specificity RNA methyltransferase RlmN n=1 Tax=Natranaerobius thermophilus (strain ATCC BAA-1301 / DSM 18059 / JW/NM-WN-LF) TaxID=457570 RepID=RLMN_NATTJ|nr:23S rRNA (adenine(2503)-C(2))-methyltransferase RlmN [Natranaerobius thermophilus]B2A2K6.1 RecName: Full=Probable dual-specificity RNA methyltransferase RlmN; AltName: Full=23S rRNA (adenine(2503)-C(2))-methyltransferase; AltName: Full=23S rRNA m2A2503 methyltransferase; AltName: Full=Ribosomal RNA large subunit methyltransferase N; AltName: Full=tRNA (adenine(37)-C(2))-methyltransferase; AltName: Full=tRNA m2A37 methyltransferase [Natranaerobius thermophilus JW/NM-WN-LF]ACB84921.1 radical SAM
MINHKQSLKDLTLNELQEYFSRKGWQQFRAKQIFDWMYIQQVDSIEVMSNIPKKLRQELMENCTINDLELDSNNIYTSPTDGTIKFLSVLKDGIGVETTIMKYDYGNTVCISSQAGCNMNCVFCASTTGGKERDLSPGEMIDQVLMANKVLPGSESINNIVVMGSGEPLENYQHLIKFLKIVNDGKGLNIGMRHITVSTCGLVPEIYNLAEEELQLNLAISLHAPNDELRNKLIPLNKIYPIHELLEACQVYFQKTGRRITFEYVLIKDFNDSIDLAKELSETLTALKMPVHVNLIPFNPVEETKFTAPPSSRISDFKNNLQSNNIGVTVRKERGVDVDGACGQLRSKVMR